ASPSSPTRSPTSQSRTGPTHHHISQLTTSADRSRLLTMD
uniref:Uncharacterized protein n=1 Tax=Aegilops tauschii subsp. strangulata TaxID=200361 RepID=A0A453GFV8_AEGTS